MDNYSNNMKRSNWPQGANQPGGQKRSIDENNYVEVAEEVIMSYDTRRRDIISTSQLRKILSMLNEIYTDVIYESKEAEPLSAEIQSRIKYLKVHCIYATREPKVKKFLEKAEVLSEIDRIGSDRKRFILFSRYMEALVAYRKYIGNDA